MNTFKMMAAPTRPIRKKKLFSIPAMQTSETFDACLVRLADSITKHAADAKGYDHITYSWLLKNLNLVDNYKESYYSQYNSVRLTVPESDEDLLIRQTNFYNEKVKYDQWYQKHASEIKEYKLKEEQRKMKMVEAERARIEARKAKKKEKLRKLLENTQNKLSKLKAKEADEKERE